MTRIFLPLWLAVGVALAALPAESQAGDSGTEVSYSLGTDGYWYAGGLPYTREKITYSERVYRNGCWIDQPYYYWRYTRYYPVVPTYTPPTLPNYTDPGWRSKFLDIARERDKFEGQIRQSMLEQAQYIEAANALGLNGNFRWNNYGSFPSFGNNYSGGSGYNSSYTTHVGNYGVSGNTVYGFTNLQQLVEAYAQNPAELFQQSAALAKQANDNGAQATAQYNTIVSDQTSGAARMLEILAKGNAAASALNAANAAPSSTTVTATANAGQQQTTGPTMSSPPTPAAPAVVAAANGSGLTAKQRDAAQYCTLCHSGPSPKVGFNVLSFWGLPAERRFAIVQKHLLTPVSDPRHMPRKDDGTGREMPAAAIAEFLKDAGKP